MSDRSRPRRLRPGTSLPALLRVVAATVALGAAAAGAAASLTALAPASTLLAVHVAKAGASYPALSSALADLDTAGAAATLTDVLRTLASAANAPSVHNDGAAQALSTAARLLQDGNARDALHSACPDLGRSPLPSTREALLAVSATSYAPAPSALLLARLAPDAHAAADDAIAALTRCFGSGAPLGQDGVTLQPLSLKGSILTVARIGDVVAAATSVDLLRAAVRLAHGTSEPSLADRIPDAVPALNGPGVGVSVDMAGIADLLGSLPGIASDATARAARTKLQDALRTVPWVAARLSAQPEGLLVESWTRVDAAGGDPALAALLRCDGCHARPSLLVPADAWSVDASPMRLQAWTTYLAGLARDVTAASGGEIDPLALLKQQTGLDLGADLFPWLGTVATTVELPAPAGTPQALVGAAARVTIVPVASADRAQAGLSRLGPALEQLLARLPRGGTGAGALKAAGLDPQAMIAIRRERYRDVAITRVQSGPGSDVGVALVGSRLVVASPSAALHSVIDTYRGGPTLHAGSLATALATAPADAHAVWAADDAARLRGAASILRALSQPVAFALQSGMAGARQAAGGAGTPGGQGPTPPDLGHLLDVTELPADALDAVAAHLGTSRGWSLWRDGMLVRRWSLPIH